MAARPMALTDGLIGAPSPLGNGSVRFAWSEARASRPVSSSARQASSRQSGAFSAGHRPRPRTLRIAGSAMGEIMTRLGENMTRSGENTTRSGENMTRSGENTTRSGEIMTRSDPLGRRMSIGMHLGYAILMGADIDRLVRESHTSRPHT